MPLPPPPLAAPLAASPAAPLARWARRLAARATGRNVLLALGAYGAFAATVLPAAEARLRAHGGQGPLDLRVTGYGAAEALATAEALGPAGRRLYATLELTMDVAYPALYTTLFCLLLSWALQRAAPAGGGDGRSSGRGVHALALLPLLVAGADLLENAAIVTLLLAPPPAASAAAHVAGPLTALKWALLGLVAACLLAALGAAAWRSLRGGGAPRPGVSP